MKKVDGFVVLEKPPYRGMQNHWLTRQLFVDVNYPSREDGRTQYKPIFSLYDPVEGYIDAHSTFVALRDPTGVKWAQEYLGSFEHWTILCECGWFKPELEKWRRELETIFTSEAIQRIQEIARGESSQALPASKYLAEKGWEKQRGRPSKAEMQAELKRQTQKYDEFEEDRKRMLGLQVVEGGKQ